MATSERSVLRKLERFWTIQDVAFWLTLHPRTVERWVSARKMPKPIRLGNFVRWDPETLRRWRSRIERRRVC